MVSGLGESMTMWLERPLLLHRAGFQRLAAALAVGTTKNPIHRDNGDADKSCEKALCLDSVNSQPLATLTENLPAGVYRIPVHGVLMQRCSVLEAVMPMTSYDTLHQQLKLAVNSPDCHTVLLDIDSPGGEVNGLFALCEQLSSLRTQHKAIRFRAHVNESAFSAAYAIAAATGQVMLTPTAGVGSIGVITAHVDQTGFDAQQGLHYTFISAGEHKTHGNPHAPLSAAAKARYQAEVNAVYDLLLEHLARYRGTTAECLRQTQAQCFYGQSAIAQGLADTLLPFSAEIGTMLASRHHLDTLLNPLAQRSDTVMSEAPTFHTINAVNQKDGTNKKNETHENNEANPMNDSDPTTQNNTFGETGEIQSINRANEKNGKNENMKKNAINKEKTAIGNATPLRNATDVRNGIGALADRQAWREELLALCQLCEVARRPDKLAELIKNDVRLDAAKDLLLAELAEQSTQPDRRIQHQQMPDGVKSSGGDSANALLTLAQRRSGSEQSAMKAHLLKPTRKS